MHVPTAIPRVVFCGAITQERLSRAWLGIGHKENSLRYALADLLMQPDEGPVRV
jgi:hypothetical protein